WFTPNDFDVNWLTESSRKLHGLALKRNTAKLFPKDSVLVVGIGATAGKISYLAVEATFNQQVTGLHTKEYSNRYFYYALKSLEKLMLAVANYTTLPILN